MRTGYKNWIAESKKVTGILFGFLKSVAILRYSLAYCAFLILWLAVAGSLRITLPRYNPGLEARYQYFAIEVPPDATFCGEKIPIDDYDVYARFDKELRNLVRYADNSRLLIRRSGRWFPVIIPILKQNHIPEDFKYVPAIESAFQDIVSPKGAAGFWQLMPQTASHFSLTINNEIDERFHLEKATRAAAKLILLLKKQFGSWSNTLAAYNMGVGSLSRNLKNQSSKDFYDINLNKESGSYVFKVAALKEVMERGNRYGIIVPNAARLKPIPVCKVIVKKSIPNLEQWAAKEKVNAEIIRLQNPWIRKNQLTISAGKSLTVFIPKNVAIYKSLLELEQVELEADSLFRKDSVTSDELPISAVAQETEKEKTVVVSPESAEKTSPEPLANEEPVVELENGYYVVRQGDNLSTIARKTHTKVKDLMRLNRLKKRSLLKIGQRIRVQ